MSEGKYTAYTNEIANAIFESFVTTAVLNGEDDPTNMTDAIMSISDQMKDCSSMIATGLHKIAGAIDRLTGSIESFTTAYEFKEGIK